MITIKQVEENIERLNTELNIDSIFIEKDNKLEKKFYKSEQLHELRSCSKILIAMAIGIAIEEKKLVNGKPINLNTPIYPTIKNVINISNNNNIEKIKSWKIKDLLPHTSGYSKELISNKQIKELNLDINNLLNYIVNQDITNEVGTEFVYNNIEPFLLSVFFQEAFGINIADYINEKIFRTIDIVDFEWKKYGEYCPGCTGLFLKHTDFHKIGKLLLNDGKYNDKQIVTENWIKEMCKMQIETPNAYKENRIFPKIGAGYFTFISRDGFIFRDGANGQYIIINKEKDLLITVMATEKNNITEMLRGII